MLYSALIALAFTGLWKLIRFAQNIQHARQGKLLFICSPIHELEVWAYLSTPVLRWMLVDYLMRGHGWPSWARFLVKEWAYEDKGLWHEILRGFPIVRVIERETVQDQALVVGGSLHPLPKGTAVIINNTAIHFSEHYWPEPDRVEPRRRLTSNPDAYRPSCLTAEQEEEIRRGGVPIPSHIRGTMMIFNEVPRVCPGRRFAQVEFMAVFVRLPRDHRLKLQGEVSKSKMERVLRLRAEGSPITLSPLMDVGVYLQQQ
ncbi:cytochrome P450 [Aspergillus pseudoustus]|uniref:Cytochrome P450 n=1 Tax=Aspergillus pseudoustus TaxID=1810923 RepID=A0ABR4K229_9EURO